MDLAGVMSSPSPSPGHRGATTYCSTFAPATSNILWQNQILLIFNMPMSNSIYQYFNIQYSFSAHFDINAPNQIQEWTICSYLSAILNLLWQRSDLLTKLAKEGDSLKIDM